VARTRAPWHFSPGPDGYTSRPVSTILGDIDFCSRVPPNGTLGLPVGTQSNARYGLPLGCGRARMDATSSVPLDTISPSSDHSEAH
jgi:hypothetical protein